MKLTNGPSFFLNVFLCCLLIKFWNGLIFLDVFVCVSSRGLNMRKKKWKKTLFVWVKWHLKTCPNYIFKSQKWANMWTKNISHQHWTQKPHPYNLLTPILQHCSSPQSLTQIDQPSSIYSTVSHQALILLSNVISHQHSHETSSGQLTHFHSLIFWKTNTR